MKMKSRKTAAFGEIMLRLSPSFAGERIVQAGEFTVEPGGSEANVAIALSMLGEPSAFISRLPDGPLTEKVIRYLKSYSVDTSNIAFKGERTGLYWTETGKGPRHSQVIYDREGSSFSGIRFTDINWASVLKGTDWFHVSGITPAVSQRAYETTRKVLQAIPARTRLSVDLNFRGKLWKWRRKKGPSVHKAMSDICKDAFLITGNETDYYNSLGYGNGRERSPDDYQQVAEHCFRAFSKLRYVGISLRGSVSASENNWSGLLFVKNKGKAFLYKGPEFKITDIVDRVGTGDSFTAGLIYGIKKNDRDFQHLVDFAVALSALNHTVRGDASQFGTDDVEHLLSNPGGRIIR